MTLKAETQFKCYEVPFVLLVVSSISAYGPAAQEFWWMNPLAGLVACARERAVEWVKKS
jgi:hypothetical protein